MFSVWYAFVGLLTACQLIPQNDLYIKSSTVNIYVYDCHINRIYIYIYIYCSIKNSANFSIDKTIIQFF